MHTVDLVDRFSRALLKAQDKSILIAVLQYVENKKSPEEKT